MKVTGRTFKTGLLFKFYNQGLKDFLYVDKVDMKEVDYLVHKKKMEILNVS